MHYWLYYELQEEGTGIHDNAAASATSAENSSPHQPADRDDDVSVRSLTEKTEDEETGSKKPNGGGECEGFDPQKVEQPSLADLYTRPKKSKKH